MKTGKAISLLFAALVISLSIAACQAEKKELKLGPEVSASDVEQALVSAIATLNPANVRTGDFVHQVHRLDYMTPSGPQGQVLSETGINIWNFQETPTELSYTLVREVVDYASDGPQKSVVSEEPIVIKKADLEPSSLTPFTILAETDRFIPFWEARANALIQPYEARVTYHKLIHEERRMAPPAAVQARENCSGLPDCQIRVQVVEYDEVVHQPGQDPQVLSQKFWISGDVPYHAGVLKECYKRLVNWEGNSLLVTECLNIQDFRFGSDD